MDPIVLFLLLFVGSVELRVLPSRNDMGSLATVKLDVGVGQTDSGGASNRGRKVSPPMSHSDTKRNARRVEDGRFKKRDATDDHRYARPHDPRGFFTTPRSAQLFPGSFFYSHPRNLSFKGAQLIPPHVATENSYTAYAILLLALLLFTVGITGNLALMCSVWHNYYLRSARNSIVASLALWDFTVLFFCLPIVVFNDLTATRLLGDFSCRLVPYMEVTSLGITTFSLCALSIDRFHTATSPRPLQFPLVEPCQSILAKLSIIWIGSLILAIPELFLWQLTQEDISSQPASPVDLFETQTERSMAAALRAQKGGHFVDVCVCQPSMDLPESVYSLVLTYHEARMWWSFGCYFCLPLLFTVACNLVTRHVSAQRSPQKQGNSIAVGCHTPLSSTSSSSSSPVKKKQLVKREQRLSSTATALAILYAVCNLPEHAINITLAYISIPNTMLNEALLALIEQFFLFIRCSVTPALLLCMCRSLGQAFIDCCCCCCKDCLHDGTYSASSSSDSTAATSTSPSTLSSPLPPSPHSPSPPPSDKDMAKLKMDFRMPAVYCNKAKHSSIVVPKVTSC